MIRYKGCECEDEFWEEIIVQNDEHYQGKNVVYYHCCSCGEDFRVEDMETKEELFL